MVTLLSRLTPYVASYGYLIVAVFIIVEGLGVPLPGETALVFVAAFTTTGRPALPLVIAIAALSAMVADSLGFALGHRYGANVFNRFHPGSGGALARSDAFFARHGLKAVFFARFIPVVRVFAAVLAGASDIGYRNFLPYSAAGSWAWALIISLLGYFFGNNLAWLDGVMRRVSFSLLLALLIVGGGAWLARRWGGEEARMRQRLATLAEQLYLRTLFDWLQRHFDPAQRTTFTVSVGFILALAGSWLFGGITQDVLAREEFALYDTAVSNWLLAHSSAQSQAFYLAVHKLANPLLIAAGTALMGAWLLYRCKLRQLFALILAVGGGALLNILLERIVKRPPATIPGAVIPGTGYSYPADPAIHAALFYGMIAYLLIRSQIGWRWQVSVALAAATLVVLEGVSQLALGTYTVTDVAGGWAAGTAWLATMIMASELLPLEQDPTYGDDGRPRPQEMRHWKT